MEITIMIIMASVFLIIAMVSYNAIRSGMKYGTGSSAIIAICVAALAVIGMRGQFEALLEEFIWAIIIIGVLLAVILIMSAPKRCAKNSSERFFRQQNRLEARTQHLRKKNKNVIKKL